VQGIGGQEKENMKKQIKYTEAPPELRESIKRSIRVPDFLPSPEILASKSKTTKITLELTQENADYFKQEAQRQYLTYPRLIERLVNAYAREHRTASSKKSASAQLSGHKQKQKPTKELKHRRRAA
jgi:hypothetical protein